MTAKHGVDILDAEETDLEALDWLEYEAIEYLNEHCAPEYTYWGHDGEVGAFGLWPCIDTAKEDCEFVSTKDQDYPSDDYRGLWMHVNDHGNVTLYFRDVAGDHEIWSVV